MVLKRKRSDSEISTSSSLLSSPLSSSNMMSIDNFQPNQISMPSLFSSRTRKRHRDNRPSEITVHQNTLSLLYSAQHVSQSQFQAPPPFRSQKPVESLPSGNSATQQSSLHSFWSIPSARQSSPSSNSTSSMNTSSTNPAIETLFPHTNCEDCDASLNPEDNVDAMDVDVMMDIDATGAMNHGCTSCGKQVCHSCSVSNLGAERKCLICAGRPKVWVGGIGWMDQD